MATVKSFVQVKLPADPGAALEAATQQYADTKQTSNANLTTIAGLTATTDNVIQSVAGAWASRTMAQLKTALALVKGDVGLGNVDNTSDATKNSASATLTNKTLTSPVINTPTGIIPSDIGAEPALTPTASKTSAYTAVSGDLVMCDGTSGAFTVTLPAAAAGRFVGIKKTDSSANAITVSRAGSDTIGATAATSITLALQDETVVLMASGATWVRKENQLTLSTLDTRFQASDSDLTTIAGLTATTDNFMVAASSAWASRTPAQAKTSLALTSSDVGLGNVNNTSNATERAATRTLTNARITKRIGTTASSSTPTADADNHDQYNVTAAAANMTIGSPTGTPTDGQMLMYRILDNGTARTIAWNAIFRSLGVTLPTTTVISKTLYVGTVYSAADTKWDVIAVRQQG